MQGHRKEKLRLYPTPVQEAQLRNFAGAHRWTWNWALAAREQHYAAVSETLTYYAQGCALTRVQRQPESAWLQAIPRRVKVGALRDLDRAYRAAFARIKRGERAGFPRFKTRKSDRASFEIPHEVRLEDWTRPVC